METKKKMKMSPPWVEYMNKLVALFGEDPDIRIAYDETTYKVTLYVNGVDKAEALGRILPPEKKHGNITQEIAVVPANKEWDTADLYRKAFEGNPVFDALVEIDPYNTGCPFCYVMFKKQVLQFYDDNMGDPNGNVTLLAQDIAKDIFRDEQHGIFFSTSEE